MITLSSRAKFRLSIIALILFPCIAFWIEKRWEGWSGFSNIVVLVATAIVIIYQLRESRINRERQEDESRRIMSPKLKFDISRRGENHTGGVNTTLRSYTPVEIEAKISIESVVPIDGVQRRFRASAPYDGTHVFTLPPTETIKTADLSWDGLMANAINSAPEDREWFLSNWHRMTGQTMEVFIKIEARSNCPGGVWMLLPEQKWLCDPPSRCWKMVG